MKLQVYNNSTADSSDSVKPVFDILSYCKTITSYERLAQKFYESCASFLTN